MGAVAAVDFVGVVGGHRTILGRSCIPLGCTGEGEQEMKTMEMVKSWKARVTFCCRKCGHQLIMNVGTYTPAMSLVLRLENVSRLDCPNCGEEPYENWFLEGVTIDQQVVEE